MRTVIIALCCVFTISTHSQIVKVKNNYPVKEVEGKKTFHPIFNFSGTQLLLTTENYEGLNLLDIKTGKIVQITEVKGAGFAPSFSTDGQEIIYESVTMRKGRQYKSLMNFNLGTKQTASLSAEMRSQTELNKIQQKSVQKQPKKTSVCTEDLKIVTYQNGLRNELSPVGDVPGYIWTSLSPNGEMILFTAVSKGTYICDLSGKIVASLGYLNGPVWYDDTCVVGMVDKDNGDNIVSSTIEMVSVDGKVRQVLTSPNRIALYPSASGIAKRIAYNTDKGELFIMEVEK